MQILPSFPKSVEVQPRYIGLDPSSEEIQLHVTLADGTALRAVRYGHFGQ